MNLVSNFVFWCFFFFLESHCGPDWMVSLFSSSFSLNRFIVHSVHYFPVIFLHSLFCPFSLSEGTNDLVQVTTGFRWGQYHSDYPVKTLPAATVASFFPVSRNPNVPHFSPLSFSSQLPEVMLCSKIWTQTLFSLLGWRLWWHYRLFLVD